MKDLSEIQKELLRKYQMNIFKSNKENTCAIGSLNCEWENELKSCKNASEKMEVCAYCYTNFIQRSD